MSEGVKVAVRVRPFNDREIGRKETRIVKMRGMQTFLTNPSDAAEKDFAFDFCYDSFDQAEADFASQERVYNDIGRLCLTNAIEGYNCSIFAYGQTGAGKSFTMMGFPDDVGLIPRFCQDLFGHVRSESNDDNKFSVEVSYLEIYKEKIHDLLNPGHKEKLEVRSNPTVGVYIPGLAKEVVTSFADIERLMEEGNKARTIAATQMNKTSSRSHSVFTIYFSHGQVSDQTTTSRSSKINLVDLAGSERQAKTGAAGVRLQEACAINKSLSALGNVISALSEGKPFVPYRDSVLTKLLQESLGGNAKTIMVAAISPAADNYEETLSTLRYASRAKKILNKAIVNENASDRIIRELREQIDALRLQLSSKPSSSGPTTVVQAGPSEEELAERRRLEEELMASIQLRKEMEMTFEQKLEQAEEYRRQREQMLRDFGLSYGELAQLGGDAPHIVNLNPDPFMSGFLVYFFKNQETLVGSANSADITLNGPNIGPSLATFVLSGKNKVRCCPVQDAFIFVNGHRLTEDTDLNNGDRIIFGKSFFFLFIEDKNALQDRGRFDYDMAKDEFMAATSNTAEARIARVVSLLDEARDLVRAMNKPFSYELKVLDEAAGDVVVNVRNDVLKFDRDVGVQEFSDMVDDIRDYFNKWAYNKYYNPPLEHDPFYAPIADGLVGTVELSTRKLLETGEIRGWFRIKASAELGEQEAGFLEAHIFVSRIDRKEPIPLTTLLGSTAECYVSMIGARDIPESMCAGVFCRFDFPEGGEIEVTERSRGANINPRFDYFDHFRVKVTDEIIKHWSGFKLQIDVFARPVTSEMPRFHQMQLKLQKDIQRLEIENDELKLALRKTKGSLDKRDAELKETHNKLVTAEERIRKLQSGTGATAAPVEGGGKKCCSLM